MARFVVSKTYRKIKGSIFQVRTPTVVTGVRGTEFAVRHDRDTGISEVFTFEGRVLVEGSSSGKIELSGGNYVMADKHGRLGNPVKLPKSNMRDIKARLKVEHEEQVEEKEIEKQEAEQEQAGESKEKEQGKEIEQVEEKEGEGKGEKEEERMTPEGEEPIEEIETPGSIPGEETDFLPPVEQDPEEQKGKIKFRFK